MIIWSKDFETGVSEIDEQHKELINRLNTVVTSGMASITKEETEKTIKFLGDYIIKHFNDEEMLQKQWGYPKYEWHKGQHQHYVNEFKKLKSEYMQNGASAKFTLVLNKSMIDWIVKHIKSVDVELGKYYLAHIKG